MTSVIVRRYRATPSVFAYSSFFGVLVVIGLYPIGEEKVWDLVDPEDVVGGYVAHIPVQGWQYPYGFIYLATLDNFPQDTVGLRPDDEQNVHQTRYRHVVLDQARNHLAVYVAYSLVLKNRWV